MYLCAILDWASRQVLAWRLSNTLTTDFCLEAVREVLAHYGTPEIFNTEQGCQFTSQEFTGLLNDPTVFRSVWMGRGAGGTTCSSNGCGGASNIDEVYLHAYETVGTASHQLRNGLTCPTNRRHLYSPETNRASQSLSSAKAGGRTRVWPDQTGAWLPAVLAAGPAASRR